MNKNIQTLLHYIYDDITENANPLHDKPSTSMFGFMMQYECIMIICLLLYHMLGVCIVFLLLFYFIHKHNCY